jgi:hypothetical protein
MGMANGYNEFCDYEKEKNCPNRESRWLGGFFPYYNFFGQYMTHENNKLLLGISLITHPE